ncbi:Coenzyme F420 hydrogenase/dehydrogenase, beta subunit C-terminal domain [[Clostridium] fimetarium]|uniref:Coenzyme F420-reducing hydrogenase, beta subunit n=1 Tax=[Clostridium] fimetarium TaxID=99656 RepID=A0A1I0RLU5_9FIRM|nr:Coenzyme F420 hydrogenase/dehydrogenase, beta subunit C-terminal domain [[Clostridium] fimetarium]SEW42004.1 Coenzyme F420-reducing hydrogenase, beta subunit [[Clostridium] fimetarium]
MIDIKDKLKCTGCSACYNCCPTNAITMVTDNEGFAYPCVNHNKCIKCNKCEVVCPFVTEKIKLDDFKKCFAAYNKNSEDRTNSSSGGMFIALSKEIIRQDGIIYGSAFDEKFLAYHTEAQNYDELQNLLGSKYMQSRIGDVFKNVKQQLISDRKVLFVGTGCQIGGLLGYLEKEYDNLICVDFICLGTPSPKVWYDYLNTFFKQKEIKKIKFKDKSLGWHTFSLKIESLYESFCRNGRQTYFFSGYFKHLYSRPSCSECIFKQGNRLSDITISDCWGYSYIAPELDDNKGLSSIVCHSEKGLKLFQKIQEQLVWKDASLDDVLKYNSNYCKSAPMGKDREAFWHDYDKLPKDKLFEKYCQPEKINLVRKILKKIKAKLKTLLNKMH